MYSKTNQIPANPISRIGTLSTIFMLFCLSASAISIDHETRQLTTEIGTNHQWYFNDQPVPVSNSVQLSINQSGQYKVVYYNVIGQKVTETIQVEVTADGIRRIFIIGDSTVMTYNESKYPMTGWGQVIGYFLDAEAFEIRNHAIGGRSSRSFFQEGRWQTVVDQLQVDDYVFIQFGHNDRDWSKPERYTSVPDFQDYLRTFVNDSRAKGAIPVLISPMMMNTYPRNVFTENGTDYRGGMLSVAEELQVPFLDLNMRSFELIESIGSDYAATYLFLGLQPGEYPNYPDGSGDFTHFQQMGALKMASLITDEIVRQKDTTALTALYEQLLPQFELKMHISDSSAGIVTRRDRYPAGAPITLKASVNTSNTFIRWQNLTTNQSLSNEELYFMEMPTSSVNIVGFFNEERAISCDGEFSDATSDFCGFCTGGTTGLLPFTCNYTYDIEPSCSDLSGYTFLVDQSASGSERIGIEYANGSDIDLTLKLFINGEFIDDVTFAATADWTTTSKHVIEIPLVPGENLIEIIDTESIGLPELQLVAWNSGNVDVQCASILKIDAERPIVFYPNPTVDHIQLNQKAFKNLDVNYYIMDMDGHEIANGIATDSIQLPQIKPGVYFIQFREADKLISSQKLLIH